MFYKPIGVHVWCAVTDRLSMCLAIVFTVCTLPNYITDAGKLYATGGDDNEKHEVRFTGINWSGMENVEGVPHGLATGQSDLVRYL